MSSWLKRFEVEYLKEDNEWNLVAQDIADLMRSYADKPNISDPMEYAARAIGFCVRHIERKEESNTTASSLS